MLNRMTFKNSSFLVYGLGSSGISAIKFLKEKKIYKFSVWDDNFQLRKKFKSKRAINLKKTLDGVDYIVLSPGISLKKTKYKKDLIRNKKK